MSRAPGPRLPRAGRALDEEVRALDVADELAHRLEPLALDARSAERRLAPQELLEVRVAAVARAQRRAHAHERLLLVDRLPRASRDEPGRQRHLLELRARDSRSVPCDRVDLHDLSRATHRHRIEDRVSDVELLLLHREAEAVYERLRDLLRLRPVRLEAADRLRVLDELLGRHLRAREEPPPHRARLAAVVLEQVAHERVRLVARLLERAAELGARRGELGGLLVRLLRLRLGSPRDRDAEPRLRLLPPLEQPVAQEQVREAVLLVVALDPVEDRLVALGHPALVGDDRVVAAPELLGRVHEELAHLLDRVARVRDAERLPRHRVQVDEGLAPQELVELLLEDRRARRRGA